MNAPSPYLNLPTRSQDEVLAERMAAYNAKVLNTIVALFDPRNASQPLACAHCGSSAHVGLVGFTKKYAVTCESEDCPVDCQATGSTRDEAVKAWNTRA